MNNEQLKAYIGVSHYVQQQADLNVPDTDATNVAYVKGYERVTKDINTAVENAKTELNESISVLESKIESCETISNEAKILIVDAIKNSPCDKIFEDGYIIEYDHSNDWFDHDKFNEYIYTEEGIQTIKDAVDTFRNKTQSSGVVRFSYDSSTEKFNTLGGYATLDLKEFHKQTPNDRDYINFNYSVDSAVNVAYAYLSNRNEWHVGKLFATFSNDSYDINVVVGENSSDVVTFSSKDLDDINSRINALGNKINAFGNRLEIIKGINQNTYTHTVTNNNEVVYFDAYGQDTTLKIENLPSTNFSLTYYLKSNLKKIQLPANTKVSERIMIAGGNMSSDFCKFELVGFYNNNELSLVLTITSDGITNVSVE